MEKANSLDGVLLTTPVASHDELGMPASIGKSKNLGAILFRLLVLYEKRPGNDRLDVPRTIVGNNGIIRTSLAIILRTYSFIN